MGLVGDCALQVSGEPATASEYGVRPLPTISDHTNEMDVSGDNDYRRHLVCQEAHAAYICTDCDNAEYMITPDGCTANSYCTHHIPTGVFHCTATDHVVADTLTAALLRTPHQSASV